MSRNVLVPVDGSKNSQKAVEFAIDWAKTHDAHIQLFHVPEPPAGEDMGVMGGYTIRVYATQDQLEETGHKMLRTAEKMVRDAGIEKVDAKLKTGNPAKTIVNQAKKTGADMIIIGTRGLGGWKSLLVGSTSHKVNQMAECTCVIVR